MDIFDFSCCTLCPRNCAVDRTKEETGVCGATDKIVCARASLHFWEEPCISGKGGSGTVFFSGCNMKCVFCQNREISGTARGIAISRERLCEIFFELKEQGAHNINLVTPTHYLPDVLWAVKRAKEQNIGIPFVYNSSGYEKSEGIEYCRGLIDIYLPDFKYMDSSRAQKYSNAHDYPQVAKRAIAEMVRQRPECKFDENGIMTEGVIVRHLLLPEGISDSKNVIRYLHETYGDKIFISIMSQYTPFGDLEGFPELQRSVSFKDYDRLLDYAISLGVENAFIQEGGAASESFIPEFCGEGVEVKNGNQ